MSRYAAIDLSTYAVTDVLETLSYEAYLARDRAEFAARWETRRAADPTLPALDAIALESDPSSVILEVGAYRETLLRARVNDAVRGLTLAGATGAALDHIGVTYYRAPRLVLSPASGSTPAVMEGDEVYRQRVALTPESWSTAGPVGAYVWHALSASGDVLDVAVYSEDEGVCLAPTVRVVVLSRLGDGTASEDLLETVRAALSRRDIRPMTDEVAVESATPLYYDLAVTLRIRAGASQAMLEDAARQRLARYCAGATRWAGDGEMGPTWLIGRTMRAEAIAGVAMGGDPNILSVDVQGGDINPQPAGYGPDALIGVGSRDFQPLAPGLTGWLFTAPRLRGLTLTSTVESMGWIG